MWEGTGGVGEAVDSGVQTPQEHGTPREESLGSWKPILAPCGHANGGWLEEALDPSLPCRSHGRSRLEFSRDGLHWHGWHHGATLSWGQVHGKEVGSRKCSTGEGRGIMVLK